MGLVFTLKTFAAVALLAVFAQWVPQGIAFGEVATGFAAVAGGLLMGMGMGMLFRHRSSLGWRAGQVKMAFDPMRGKPRPSQWAAQQPGAQGA